MEAPESAEQEQQRAQRGVPLAEVTANLEAVLREEGDVQHPAATESDMEAELEGFPRAGPQSFASLFTDDESEVAAEVDPSLMLVNCGLSEQTVSAPPAGKPGAHRCAACLRDVHAAASSLDSSLHACSLPRPPCLSLALAACRTAVLPAWPPAAPGPHLFPYVAPF